MKFNRFLAISFVCLAAPLLGMACSSGGNGGGEGGSAGQGGMGQGGGSSGALKWWATCGDPVCMDPGQGGAGGAGGGAPSGVDPCTTEKIGDACTTKDALCWPAGSTCGVLLKCSDTDPAVMCPISQAEHKTNISYLPERDLQQVHDDLMRMKIATWHYKNEPAGTREHLGFIIDDNPQSPAVMSNGERVDLYGYTSMAVAAVQTQDKRLEALERELKALREEVIGLREKNKRCE